MLAVVPVPLQDRSLVARREGKEPIRGDSEVPGDLVQRSSHATRNAKQELVASGPRIKMQYAKTVNKNKRRSTKPFSPVHASKNQIHTPALEEDIPTLPPWLDNSSHPASPQPVPRRPLPLLQSAPQASPLLSFSHTHPRKGCTPAPCSVPRDSGRLQGCARERANESVEEYAPCLESVDGERSGGTSMSTMGCCRKL